MNLSTSSRNVKPETRFPTVAPVTSRGGGLRDPMAGGGIEDGLALNDSLQDSLSGGDFAANDAGFSDAAPSASAQPVEASGQEDALAGDERQEGDDAEGAKAEGQAGAEGGAEAGGGGAPGAGGGAGAAGAPGKGDEGQEAKADSAAGDKSPASNAGGAAPGASAGGCAPTSPDADPAFQAVKASIETKAEAQQEHPEGSAAAAEAQGAAVGPPNEVSSKAGAAQVETMEAQEPGTFDKEAFKAAIATRIAELTPGNLDELDKFKESGGAAQVKSDVIDKVGEGKDAAAQSIEQAATAEPDESGIEAKDVSPIEPPIVGDAPQIDAAGAAPKPRPDSEFSLDEGPQELDAMMSKADVTEEQLLNSNEPDFVASVDAKKAAEADSATQPGLARADEAQVLQSATAGVGAETDQQLTAMNQVRASAMGQVEGKQGATKTKDEAARAEVANQIETIYNDTKTAVEARLKKLDEDVDKTFDAGATSAQTAFEAEVETKMDAWKAERYAGLDGKGRWFLDLVRDLPPEVNLFYETARKNYVTAMDGVIDDVAGVVETGLNETKTLITQGRQKVAEYVKGLPKTLKGVGAGAASEIEGRFAELDQAVEDKQGALIDHLAQKYTENLSAIDARIEKMKEENKGWGSAAKEKLGGVIQTIRDLKNMLTGVLARAGDAIGLIIKDPIGFLGNLVTGVGAGLRAFMGNIGTHLKTGLMEWLFGAISSAGLTMPESFDLKGILDLALQVLGLTKDAFRARAVQLLGEQVVSAIETGVEVFRVVMTEGIGGLWTWVKDKVGDLKEMVLGTIRDWVSSKVITAGITWILSMLNPASAFIKACKAVYDIIMFFVDRGSQIMSLVNAVIDSVMAIAQGNTGGVAKAVEGALAKGIPVAIGFLSSLLGLTGIDKFIEGAINKIREPVSKAIDWVIQKAKDLGAAILAKLGFGKDKDGEKGKDERTPDEKQADLDAALGESWKLMDHSDATAESVAPKLPEIRNRYRLKTLSVAHKDGKYKVVGTVNPEGETNTKSDDLPYEIDRDAITVAIHLKGQELIERKASLAKEIVANSKDGIFNLGNTADSVTIAAVLQELNNSGKNDPWSKLAFERDGDEDPVRMNWGLKSKAENPNAWVRLDCPGSGQGGKYKDSKVQEAIADHLSGSDDNFSLEVLLGLEAARNPASIFHKLALRDMLSDSEESDASLIEQFPMGMKSAQKGGGYLHTDLLNKGNDASAGADKQMGKQQYGSADKFEPKQTTKTPQNDVSAGYGDGGDFDSLKNTKKSGEFKRSNADVKAVEQMERRELSFLDKWLDAKGKAVRFESPEEATKATQDLVAEILGRMEADAGGTEVES